MPSTETAALLDHDRYVARWAGVYFETLQVDGHNVPALAMSPDASVGPTVRSGHALASAREIVLGTSTLAILHKHVGDTVVAKTGRPSPVLLHIVGTATMATIWDQGDPALQIGTGAVVSSSLFPRPSST